MKKLRLLLFEDCNRNCKGCCNKDWDLENLPVCMDYSSYDLIMLTGGEPMLKPELVKKVIKEIKEQASLYGKCPQIILYTAKTDDKMELAEILDMIDGLTVTLHDSTDIDAFLRFDEYLDNLEKIDGHSMVGARKGYFKNKSLRLNVFSGVRAFLCAERWNVKVPIQWIKDCPLPKDEVFMRYKGE